MKYLSCYITTESFSVKGCTSFYEHECLQAYKMKWSYTINWYSSGGLIAEDALRRVLPSNGYLSAKQPDFVTLKRVSPGTWDVIVYIRKYIITFPDLSLKDVWVLMKSTGNELSRHLRMPVYVFQCRSKFYIQLSMDMLFVGWMGIRWRTRLSCE